MLKKVQAKELLLSMFKKKISKFTLKFNLFDIIIGIISVGLALVLLVVNNIVFSTDKELDNKVAYIYYDSIEVEKVYFKDIKTDEVKVVLEKEKYPLLNADMVIVISKEKGIKVEEEKSPQKICSKQGWVSKPDMPVVCLPNSVYVIISDVNNVDFDIGLE